MSTSLFENFRSATAELALQAYDTSLELTAEEMRADLGRKLATLRLSLHELEATVSSDEGKAAVADLKRVFEELEDGLKREGYL